MTIRTVFEFPEGFVPVADYSEYAVARTGEVYGKTKILKPVRQKSGYYTVTFKMNGKVSTHRIQHLVLEAFIGPRPPGTEALHRNGDKSNNSLDNLSWDTPRENAADRIRHGTQAAGTRHGMVKLTETQVLEIVALRGVFSAREIANLYLVSKSTVLAILAGEKWKTVTGL